MASLAVAASASAGDSWPTFLPPPSRYSPDEVAAVEKAWKAPTLHRSITGPPAPMPFEAYLALVDAPELTAAAARHLRIAQYEIRKIGPDWYEADDHDGSHGFYRVLVRQDGRRVTMSWGSRHGPLLGTIRGSALTLLEFEAHGDQTLQRLETYVVIDNLIAARLARLLLATFGPVADRKLAHGFEVTARVAAWATERPGEFCAWVAQQPVDSDRRHHLLASLAACRDDRGHPVASSPAR